MHTTQKKLLKLATQEDVGQYGYRKLGEKIGESHPQKVKWHLSKLLKDGYLYKNALGQIVRADEAKKSSSLLHVPIVGLANCGEALAFADNTVHGELTLSPSLVKTGGADSLFAVQAIGDSMNSCSIKGQPINNGDYVIVDSSKTTPSNGDYVVSSLEGLANIKKYIRDDKNQVIALVSESTTPRPPIVLSQEDLESYHVHGQVISVVPSYT